MESPKIPWFQTTKQIEMLHHLGASPFCLGYYYEIFQYVPTQRDLIHIHDEIPGCAPWDFHKQCSWCHALPLG